jgi:CubicO group peptidase (beta-lactamase class C family)
MEDAIGIVLKRAVEQGVFPGAVAGFIREGQKGIVPFGTIDGRKAVGEETIYDVASITKSIPTASLALLLHDQKLFSVDEPVKKFLSEFRHDTVTIRHLLTQTLVIGYNGEPLRLSIQKNKDAEEILSLIYHADLLASPGEAFAYTNAASILLGKVIEKVIATPLKTLAEEQFFHP